MDDTVTSNVVDDSGSELHGTVSSFTSSPGKFSRSVVFNGHTTGPITITNSPKLHFGKNSFSFTAWIKNNDYTYPKTSLAVKQGNGCYLKRNQQGFIPGWDIGHGFTTDATPVCIRDNLKNHMWVKIKHNPNFTHAKLRGQWTHYAVVFKRFC